MGKRVDPQDLSEGQEITVTLNGRAQKHTSGVKEFDAVVDDIVGSYDVILKPVGQLQEEVDRHTWHIDSGYFHGYQEGSGRTTDIGKILYVETSD